MQLAEGSINASAEPDCDVPNPPPVCGGEVPEPPPPPEQVDVQLRSSGLAFGRDIAMTPASQPVTVDVTQRNAGADEERPIGQRVLIADVVSVRESRG